MRNIKIEFSGNLEMTAIDVVMVKFDGETTTRIDGEEWLELSDEDREAYILESFCDAYDNCFNEEFTSLEVSELE